MNSPALVIIIDDEKPLAESLEMVFELQGYHVVTAGSAEEGLPLVVERSPEVVLMDGGLPGIEGDEAIQELRSKGYSGVIIGISAEERAESMRAAGADSFLGKPLEISSLLALVETFLKKKSALSGENLW